ncbi:Hypothetical protein HDN1F_27990 [gamma proteobacterium HdN1]|nr:Hypothetical protein HDN1F_27990 [gamma proteobacterium HdN1]
MNVLDVKVFAVAYAVIAHKVVTHHNYVRPDCVRRDRYVSRAGCGNGGFGGNFLTYILFYKMKKH